MPTIAQDTMDALEFMIDGHGLAAVVGALADICSEKADHEANWQAPHLAKEWKRKAAQLYRARNNIEG